MFEDMKFCSSCVQCGALVNLRIIHNSIKQRHNVENEVGAAEAADSSCIRTVQIYFINKNSGNALDIRDGILEPGAEVIQYDWNLQNDDGYIFCLAHPNLVLDIDSKGHAILSLKRDGVSYGGQRWHLQNSH
ncbi:uncharacterized protein EV154DRAFT_550830 [Mucor mucedo]|uniref:uncharacterized protein n=1 Tax=Mucor mucedo TaxID=29922 RepID=UPI00221F4A62|nr:uncharacterized protein EV154DRAFT_550830 [Mucor mucedo]KAI7892250.1 hypothetical protein EV154DRAFT_550830 [Mucor mucedo]